MNRTQVVIRLVLLCAIGMIGCSSVYWLLYLVLPAAAALLISQHGPERYLAEDAPRIVHFLRWFAAASAYLWLLTDQWPNHEQVSAVEVEIEAGGSPTASSALLRLVYSVPALLLWAVLATASGLAWLVGAAVILVGGRIPAAIADWLAAMLRYQLRLLAYHLSLVDRYPSLEDAALAVDIPPADPGLTR
ncbi:MAG: DUF4389 domain-containing protein [Polyangiaceae bacterium]|jgi:hypothetical protein